MAQTKNETFRYLFRQRGGFIQVQEKLKHVDKFYFDVHITVRNNIYAQESWELDFNLDLSRFGLNSLGMFSRNSHFYFILSVLLFSYQHYAETTEHGLARTGLCFAILMGWQLAWQIWTAYWHGPQTTWGVFVLCCCWIQIKQNRLLQQTHAQKRTCWLYLQAHSSVKKRLTEQQNEGLF